MPSIKTTTFGKATLLSKKAFSKTALIIFCTSLMACGGGGSGTTRVNPDDNTTTPTPTTKIAISVHMPMYIEHAKLEIRVVGDTEPLYSNDDYTITAEHLQTTIDTLDSSYRGKIVWVKLTGKDQTRMYDPILNRLVAFNGELNAIAAIQDDMVINITPISEAIYQRSLVRAGNLDLSNPDITLVQDKHITKAVAEVSASVNSAFSVPTLPTFSNLQSISVIEYSASGSKNYINIFTGMGLLKLWQTKFPDSENTYLDLAKNLAVDLRDGYLDGGSIVGDNTPFKALVTTVKNTAPEKNNLLDIGENQKAARVGFGTELKAATLDYAINSAFQQVINPKGLAALETNQYYTQSNVSNSTVRLRWNGAGDYRPAFGITTTAKCQGISVPPCKQGLNADDISTSYTDIAYLIGTHKVGSCTVKMYPSGDVQLTQSDKIYKGQINRDLTDNLLQIDSATRHYILNVGAGEVKPPYFMQFEIKDGVITAAQTGYAEDFYPVKLTNTQMTCS